MIEKLPFGKTGHLSTRTLFGAAALGGVTQDEADQAMEAVYKYGVNHIDTAASYGEAELRLGPWIEKHRDDFFLATKTGERTYDKAIAQIEDLLKRMRTDHVDLIQLHAVIEDEEWETAMGPGGALEAAIEAREKGWTRFIGVTSHSLRAPMMHMRSLERFPFDSVLLPYNYMLYQIPEYKQDFDALMKICKERNVAVQLIKTNQRRKWGERPRENATWYEPFTDQEAITKAIHWAMGTQPHAFLNTSGDVHVMPKFLEAASTFDKGQIPSNEEMEELVAEKQAEPLWP